MSGEGHAKNTSFFKLGRNNKVKEKEKNTKICTFLTSQGLSYDCVFFINGKVVFTVWLVNEFEAFLYLKHYTCFF